jgi:hypothetical protein
MRPGHHLLIDQGDLWRCVVREHDPCGSIARREGDFVPDDRTLKKR